MPFRIGLSSIEESFTVADAGDTIVIVRGDEMDSWGPCTETFVMPTVNPPTIARSVSMTIDFTTSFTFVCLAKPSGTGKFVDHRNRKIHQKHCKSHSLRVSSE